MNSHPTLRFGLVALLALGSAVVTLPSLAASRRTDGFISAYLWDGGGSDDSFSTAANWTPNFIPQNDGTADLYFAGGVRLTPVADTAYRVNSLTFNANAGAFTLSGGALAVGGSGLTQNSANAQTINNAVTVGVSQSWRFGSGAGALNLGNDLIVSAAGNGATLSLSGGAVKLTSSGNAFALGASPDETGSLNLSGTADVSPGVTYVGLYGNGHVVQSGGNFGHSDFAFFLAFGTSSSTGTYTLSGAGSTCSTGSTFVGYRGTAVFTQSGGLHATGQLVLAPYAQDLSSMGTYHLDGGTLRAGSVVTGEEAPVGTSTFNFNGGTLEARADSTTFLGGLTTVNVRNGGARIDTFGFDVTIAQRLLHSSYEGDAAADGGLLKTGAGTLTLTGANTYTGSTRVTAGTLALGTGGALGLVNGIRIGAGATLDFTALGGGGYTLDGGRMLTNLGTVAGNLTLASGATLTGAGALDGALTVNAGGLVTIEAGALTVSGNVTNDGTVQLVRGAALSVGGAFVNNSVLDIITGSFSAPAGFTNNGVVLDSGVVKTKSVSRSGGVVTVVVDSYTGHAYRLQRRDSLSSGSFEFLGNPKSGSTGTALTFTDSQPAAGEGFYRVVVDPDL